MTLHRLPAVFYRGGTSKAVMFKPDDLPSDRAQQDRIFLSVMGSPDPNGRQLDGMGGGVSSLSKICIVGPSKRPDVDVDYTFAQIGIKDRLVDYSGNCGNMSSAVGPFAVEEGLVKAPRDGEAVVRIFNTNTSRVIVSRFEMKDGAPKVEGSLALDGVSGSGAPIRLEFLEPGGAKTGKLLPTGRPADFLDIPGFGRIEASIVDAANPCVFVDAASLGRTGVELPAEIEADQPLLDLLEAIRCAGSVAAGIAPDLVAAAGIPSIPKVAMVTGAKPAQTLSGRGVATQDMTLTVRMISVGQPHRAVPVTGATCLAIATRVEGTLAQRLSQADGGVIRIAHPSGIIVVDAAVDHPGEATRAFARFGALYRTARRLFDGAVYFR